MYSRPYSWRKSPIAWKRLTHFKDLDVLRSDEAHLSIIFCELRSQMVNSREEGWTQSFNGQITLYNDFPSISYKQDRSMLGSCFLEDIWGHEHMHSWNTRLMVACGVSPVCSCVAGAGAFTHRIERCPRQNHRKATVFVYIWRNESDRHREHNARRRLTKIGEWAHAPITRGGWETRSVGSWVIIIHSTRANHSKVSFVRVAPVVSYLKDCFQ